MDYENDEWMDEDERQLKSAMGALFRHRQKMQLIQKTENEDENVES